MSNRLVWARMGLVTVFAALMVVAIVGPVLAGTREPAPVTRAVQAALAPCTVGSEPFSDVPASHPACAEIKWLKDEGITNGYADGTYRPASVLTRMAAAAFLARFGEESEIIEALITNCGAPPFNDVPIEHPFCPEIQWIKAEGITNGYSDNTYRPTLATTRMAFSAFLARLVEASLPSCGSAPFSDVPTSHPFCPEIAWVGDNDISDGNGDGSFGPAVAVDRAAAAVMLYRASLLLGDAPVVTTSAGDTSYTEGAAAVAIDNAVTVTDADDTDLVSAVVSITSGFQAGDDLTFVDQSGISGSYNSGTGVLTLTGLSSVANYETALRSITFDTNGVTSNDNPVGSKTVEFKVNDGAADSNAATKQILVTPLNDAPVVTTSDGATTYSEGGAAVTVDGAVTVTDADDTNLEGATVSITSGAEPTDTLAFTSGSGISGMYSAGTLTLSGTATVAEYQAALRSVTFVSTSDGPPTTKTISFAATDGTDSSAADTKTLSITQVNDGPVNTAPASATMDEDTTLNFTAGNAISVADPDAATLEIDLSVTNGTLTMTTVAGLTFTGGDGNSDSAMTFTGSLTNINNALASLSFTPTLNFPGAAASGIAAFSITSDDGGQTGTGGTLTDTDNFDITVNQVNDPPSAGDDTFNGANSAVGNTALVVNDPTDGAPTQSGPKKSISGDILSNDSDAEGGSLSITAGTISTANGGSVTLEADGDFIYVSDPLDLCVPTSDSFNYTLNDNQSPNQTDTGTVTIALSGCVWYVSNNGTGNGGTSTAPFDTLAQAESASGTGHSIFVFDGDNTSTGYSAGINLKASQKLIGEAANLVVGSDTLWTGVAGSRPTLVDTDDDVVALDDGNEVRGLSIDPSGTGSGIAGTVGDNSGGTIDDVQIVDTGIAGTQPLLELDSTTGTWTISNLSVDNSAATSPPSTAIGIRLNAAGTVNFPSAGTIAVNTKGAAGLSVDTTQLGSAATPAVFDTITVAGSGSGGIHLFNLSVNSVTQLGDGSGADLSLTTTSGATAALDISAGRAITVPNAGTANISATGGPAISVTGTPGISLAFDNVSSMNSASNGIRLTDLGSGTFSATGGTVSGVAAGFTSFVVSNSGANGTGNISYPGTLANGAGQALSISGRSGGTVDITGPIQDTNDAGGGITVTSNTGGVTNITNASVTINTTTSGGVNNPINNAITFSGSDGHTLNITGGNLDIDAGAGNGKGIDAVASGTLNVPGANNTIVTTTGVALNITDTDIGSSGVTFVSISANGAPSGIILSNTGSTAGLTVTGDLGSAANASGGTIQNTTGHAISLASTRSVSLDQISVVDSSNDGINGLSVTGFNLTNSTIAGAGNGANEYGAFITNLFGTSTIDNVSITNSQTNNLKISNNAATAGTLTISDSTFTTTDAANGGDAVNVETGLGGAAVGDFTVNLTDNNDLNNTQGDGFQGSANDNSTLRVTVNGANSNYNGNLGSAVNLAAEGNATLYALVENLTNVSTGTNGVNGLNVINIQTIEATSTPTAHVTVRNNLITGLGNNASGIRVILEGRGTLNAKLEDNTITGMGANGIVAQARAGNGALNLTIDNNSVNLASGTALDGVSVESGSSAGGDTNTVRLDLHDSDSASAGAGPQSGYRLRVRTGTTFLLEDFSGNGANDPDVTAWVNGPPKSNTGTTDIVSDGTFGTIADVPEPTLP